MKIEALDDHGLSDFIAYCKKHRREVDDSFLYDEDLDGFAPDGENPAVVALDACGVIAGAASLIIDGYMRRGNRARFRIFHSASGGRDCYSAMLEALLPHAKGLGCLEIFAPEQNESLRGMLGSLGFRVERYSLFLVREGGEAPEAEIPEGFRVGVYVPGRDDRAWCDIRNAAFANLKGSEAPMTAEMIVKANTGPGSIEGGAMVLYCEAEPVGVVRVEQDEFEGGPVAAIGPLALLPAYQGRGLGRGLLRTALRFAGEKGFPRAVLCVNAENERAASLYFHEGFRKAETAICYRYELGT